jgi:glycosyltransferase involved in cell wall biosynthesis
VYRLALRNRHSITIFQNEEDRAEFVSQGFVSESQAVLIRGSGVDCQVFLPPSVPPQDKIVMFASRMLREKGLDDFVGAARQIRPQYPQVRFVLVGEPDDSPTSVSTEQLKTWHDEGVVEWWGRCSRMEEIIPQASIVVLPTFYREGLPKVLLEAAACGVPMIATDVPGCRDIVQPGTTGLLVEPHDPIGLAQAMRELLDDDSYCRRLGTNGRALAESEFSVDHVVDQTLHVYRSLLLRQ